MIRRLLLELSRRVGLRRDSAAMALAALRQALALEKSNRCEEAAECFRRTLILDPGHADAHAGLGRVLLALGRNAQAAECFRRAIASDPAQLQAHLFLGNILQLSNDFEGARKYYDLAVERDPEFSAARNNRATALLRLGEYADASSDFAVVAQQRPDNPVFASNKLMCDLTALADAPGSLFAEHVAWGTRFAAPYASSIPRHVNAPVPERKLRLGYVSADFCEHAMSNFIEPLLAHCDAAEFEVFCYSNCQRPDAITARFESLARNWRNVAAVTDTEVARRIESDAIDLLVDLSGHTANNRLLVFARKPAPLQFTFLGYPNTTGVSAIDYRITDAYADPPGMTENYYVESLLRMPDCWCCFRLPDRAPEIAPPPALSKGFVTFGSFNGFMKINNEVLDTWASLLKRVRGSKLIMVAVAEGAAQQRTRAELSARGIGEDRVRLLPMLAWTEYMKMRNHVDIALDPFPINGGTTTCESLWMGVPTVTLAGRTFLSRAGVSLLTNAGLPEFVASDLQQYVQIAVSLASDLPRLTALRSGSRARLRASPLCDASHFVANLERLYRDVWRQWCARSSQAQALR